MCLPQPSEAPHLAFVFYTLIFQVLGINSSDSWASLLRLLQTVNHWLYGTQKGVLWMQRRTISAKFLLSLAFCDGLAIAMKHASMFWLHLPPVLIVAEHWGQVLLFVVRQMVPRPGPSICSVMLAAQHTLSNANKAMCCRAGIFCKWHICGVLPCHSRGGALRCSRR